MDHVSAGSGRRRRILVVGSGGGGGDLHPLLVLAEELSGRGHDVAALGDAVVAHAMQRLGVPTTEVDPELDLTEQYAFIARVAGDRSLPEQAARLRDHLSDTWAPRLQPVIHAVAQAHRSDVLVTSLFGAGPVRLAAASAALPWVAVNSTFYVGPNPPRPPEGDFGPRAALFAGYFAVNICHADCVLHASDRNFDYSFDRLPPHHHYVGPLLHETAEPVPRWLNEAGDPWVLVSVSSLRQDDSVIARAAIAGLADVPARTLATVGPHARDALGPLPLNARVERFVPHSAVLARARLMVGHAGHGSVMRALWHGVPMVLVPWGRDQGGVAARASHLGVAVVVRPDELTPGRIRMAAQSALADRALINRVSHVSSRLRALESGPHRLRFDRTGYGAQRNHHSVSSATSTTEYDGGVSELIGVCVWQQSDAEIKKFRPEGLPDRSATTSPAHYWRDQLR